MDHRGRAGIGCSDWRGCSRCPPYCRSGKNTGHGRWCRSTARCAGGRSMRWWPRSSAHYVFPEKTKQIETLLRQRQRNGDYDAITNGDQLAKTLTADMASVAHDLHMRVEFSPEVLPAEETALPGQGAASSRVAVMQWLDGIGRKFAPMGVSKVEVMPANIGYLNLSGFPRPELSAPKYAAAMDKLADTGAMIIDMRGNRGGAPEGGGPAGQLFRRPAHAPQRHLLSRHRHHRADVDAGRAGRQALWRAEKSGDPDRAQHILRRRRLRLHDADAQARHPGRRAHRRRRPSHRRLSAGRSLPRAHSKRPHHQPGHRHQLGRRGRDPGHRGRAGRGDGASPRRSCCAAM